MKHEPSSPEEIGRRIKRVRAAWKLSQVRLAAICQTGDNTVRHWEAGRQRPQIEHMERLVAETGLTLDWIYLGRWHTLPASVAAKLHVVAANEPD